MASSTASWIDAFPAVTDHPAAQGGTPVAPPAAVPATPTAAAPAAQPSARDFPQWDSQLRVGTLPDGSATRDPAVFAGWAQDWNKAHAVPPAKSDTASWIDAMPGVVDHPAAQPAPPDLQPGQKTGMLANIGAGTSEQVAGALGAPVDLATGAINLIPRGINAVAGTHIPTIQNPVGGSDWWKSAEGLVGANPNNVVPQTDAQQIGRAAGSGAAAMMLPWAGARALPALAGVPGALQGAFGAGSAGAQAAMGAAAGAGGQLAENAVPEPYKPIANFAGQMAAGGLPAAAGAAGHILLNGASRAASDFVAPMTAAGRTRLAAQQLQRGATNPAEAAAAINEGGKELVPGSQPTLYQATGDQGLGQLERGIAAKNPDQFLTRRNQQNAAQSAALTGLAPENANVEAPVTLFRGMLDWLDAANEATENAAVSAHAKAKAASIAPELDRLTEARAVHQAVRQSPVIPVTPELLSAQTAYAAARQAPTVPLTPELEAAQAAHTAAREAEVAPATAELAAARQRTAALGGAVPAGADAQETALQGYGKTLRKPLAEARADAKKTERRLWAAIDPDGTLNVAMDPVRDAAKIIVETMPKAAEPMDAKEAATFAAARLQPKAQKFSELGALRSRVRAQMSEELRANGRTPKYLRLSQLLDSIHAAMQPAFQEQATRDADLGRRLADLVGTTAEGEAAAGVGHGGVPGAASPDPAPVPARPAGATGAPAERPGGAAGGQGLSPPPAGPEKRLTQPRSPKKTAVPGAPIAEDNGLTPNWTAEASARDAAARAATKARAETFDEAPGVGEVLRPGKSADTYHLADSRVPAALLTGKGQAERVQSFLRAGGDRQALLDYAAFDLRRSAENADGTLDPVKAARWVHANAEAATVLPELKTLAEPAVQARLAYDAATAAAEEARKAAIKQTAEAVRTAAEASAAARKADLFRTADAVRDAAAASAAARKAEMLRAESEIKAAAESAKVADLARRDEITRTAEAARAATARRNAERTAFLRSAAGKFTGEGDPVRVVGRILSSDTAEADLQKLAKLTAGNPDARAGLQRAIVEHMLDRVKSNQAAGNTGTNVLKSDVFQTWLRQREKALRSVFSPAQIENMRAVAADLQRANRSVQGSKLPGGSNTAQDTAALGAHTSHHPSMLTQMVAADIVGETAMHGADMLVPGHRLIAKGLGMAGTLIFGRFREAGFDKVEEMVTQAMLDPALGKILLMHPSVKGLPDVLGMLGQRLRALTTMAAATSDRDEPAVPRRKGR